jgi:dimethylargininase
LGEHQAYVAALTGAGVRVTVLEPLEAFPDSIFVEDPALVFTEAALQLRPGAASRGGEARELSAALAAHFPRVLSLNEGFADGGDVLVTPGGVFIGLSARTDRAGAAALQTLLDSIGRRAEVMEVPRGTLHLKTDCSLIDEDTILVTAELAQAAALSRFRKLIVPHEERGAANAVRVNEVVLLRAGCPRTAEMVLRHGVEVIPLPASEIGKIDAGLSCMSLRWFRSAG